MPTKLQIEYLPSAETDLMDIFDYIFADSPKSAEKMIDLFDSKIANLGYFPFAGKEVSDKLLRMKGYRLLIIDNYLVFYVIKKNIIEIRRILHGSRNYQFLL